MTETVNKGHRQRLRDRFAGEEKDSRSEEALLELLLTYAIPRKDVQPLAKSLLADFGTLMAVLQAHMKTLSKFNGLTDNSAARQAGDYTLPTNLIAANHLWEIRE